MLVVVVCWRWCLPIVCSHYYALIAYAIEHYVVFEWMVMLVVCGWSLPIVRQALSPDVVTFFCCCPIMEDACVLVWRWCLLLGCSCYTLTAYAVVHYVELEWMMMLAVLRSGLQIVCQALIPDDIKVLFYFNGGCLWLYGDDAYQQHAAATHWLHMPYCTLFHACMEDAARSMVMSGHTLLLSLNGYLW